MRMRCLFVSSRSEGEVIATETGTGIDIVIHTGIIIVETAAGNAVGSSTVMITGITDTAEIGTSEMSGIRGIRDADGRAHDHGTGDRDNMDGLRLPLGDGHAAWREDVIAGEHIDENELHLQVSSMPSTHPRLKHIGSIHVHNSPL